MGFAKFFSVEILHIKFRLYMQYFMVIGHVVLNTYNWFNLKKSRNFGKLKKIVNFFSILWFFLIRILHMKFRVQLQMYGHIQKIACFINLLKDCVNSKLRVLSIIKHAILSDRKKLQKLRVLSVYLRIASIALIASIASIACFITSHPLLHHFRTLIWRIWIWRWQKMVVWLNHWLGMVIVMMRPTMLNVTMTWTIVVN